MSVVTKYLQESLTMTGSRAASWAVNPSYLTEKSHQKEIFLTWMVRVRKEILSTWMVRVQKVISSTWTVQVPALDRQPLETVMESQQVNFHYKVMEMESQQVTYHYMVTEM